MIASAPDSAGVIIDVQQLRKDYVSWSPIKGRKKLSALRGVSLDAKAGEVFGLLGPNGAGKTTLIKTLLGVIRPSGGKASLFGLPVGSAAARQRVGYLPESLRVDRHHTARSALRYYGRMSRMDDGSIRRRSDELLDLVGLAGRDRESVRRFSKGMYQRLGLAQALMHDPDLLVLDEPTDGLDPVGRNEVRQVIDRLRDLGKTIFLNSHILQEVELVCTRVAIMSSGQIRGSGTLDELADEAGDPKVAIVVIPTSDWERPGNSAVELSNLLPQPVEGQWTVETLPASEGLRIRGPIHSQDHLDQLVDQLRAQGHSLVELRVHRPTLEETFLRLVGEAAVSD
ncbi:MAG: ABC transporter ATP-binding protein [Planctomycetota bacterium]